MRPAAPGLGIVGSNPLGTAGPVRAGSFSQLQRLTGELAQTSYLAGHAACHGLMNHVRRVVVCGPAPGEDLADALLRLVTVEDLAMVVVPGLVGPPALAAARRLAELLPPDAPRPELWLDAPQGASVEELLRLQAELGRDARLVGPWVPTQSPGRPRPELLPPTCLLGPLRLGATRALSGLHTPPPALAAADLARLSEAGIAWLAPTGPRGQLALARASGDPTAWDPTGADPAPDPVTAAVRAVLQRHAHSDASGPILWRRLERDVRGALQPLQRRGLLTAFHVRCDAETNDAGGPDPVVEVHLKTPRRVSEVILRLSAH